ncbi:MAG: glycosyltransferase [Lentisphaerae bacterium]|nr:glycosyltransferase [Lentisphaerota bacterium]
MKISVAIAAYRGEKFIGEQLASIAAQTRVPDEVVICDDSPDHLTEKAVSAFRELLNIRYYRNTPALGVAGNFNKALALADGDLVFLCDQDDLWYPEKVAVMSKAVGDEELAAVFCDSDITDADCRPLNITHLESRGYGFLKNLPPGVWEGQFLHCCRRVPAAGHDMALTGKLLEKLLPIPEISACHDNFLGVAAAALDCWHIVPRPLGIFRRHDASASGAGKGVSLLSQLHEAVKSVQDDTFTWNVRLFRAVLETLPDLTPERKKLLAERIEFSEKRAEMNLPFFRRLPLIYAQWRCGNYSRFGRGWKNVIQDLFLR